MLRTDYARMVLGSLDDEIIVIGIDLDEIALDKIVDLVGSEL
jgi:hypothetical protein